MNALLDVDFDSKILKMNTGIFNTPNLEAIHAAKEVLHLGFQIC